MATTRKRRSGAKKSRRPSSSFTTYKYVRTHGEVLWAGHGMEGPSRLGRAIPPLPPFPCPFPAVGPPRPKLAVLSVSRCPLCTPYGHLQIHPQLGHHWASRDETEVTRAYSSSYFLFPRGRGKGLWHGGQKGNVRADIFFPFFLRSRKREPSHLDAKGGRNWGEEALPSSALFAPPPRISLHFPHSAMHFFHFPG